MGGVNFEDNAARSLGLILKIREPEQKGSCCGKVCSVVGGIVKPAALLTIGALFAVSILPTSSLYQGSAAFYRLVKEFTIVSALGSVVAVAAVKAACVGFSAMKACCTKTA
jgi:hypothetical protein